MRRSEEILKIGFVLLFRVGLLLTSLFVATESQAQQKPPRSTLIQESKLEEFLENDAELRRFYNCTFRGKFIDIPDSLSLRLAKSFPDRLFFIAEMDLFTDLPPRPMRLILMTEKEGGDVLGFIWGGLWTMPSASFSGFVTGKRIRSIVEATEKVKLIAELLTLAGPLRVGNTTIKRQSTSVGLSIDQSDELFRTLRLEIKRRFTVGKFSIIRQGGNVIAP